MKKKLLILLIPFFIIIFVLYGKSIEVFVNWNIYLPSIKENNIIFEDFFRNGDRISILTLSNSKKVSQTIKINHFETIQSENIDTIREILQSFFNGLSNDGKQSFDNNINIEQILDCSENNYYLYKTKKEKGHESESFTLLILDSEKKIIYEFTSIRWNKIKIKNIRLSKRIQLILIELLYKKILICYILKIEYNIKIRMKKIKVWEFIRQITSIVDSKILFIL